MRNFFCFFFLFATAFANLSSVPVLYEGRIRPFGTLPQEEQIISKAMLAPLNDRGMWGILEQIKENGSLYPREIEKKILSAKSDENLAQALVEGYKTIEKTPFLRGAQKTLFYPSLKQLKAELFLAHLPVKLMGCAAYLLAAVLLVAKRWRLGLFVLITVFAFHTSILLLRCYILKRPPVSNMNETILYVPWTCMLLAFLFANRRHVLLGGSLVSFSLFLLLPMQLSFDTVQAVLDSQYWLIIHVMMVVGSYGIFFLAGILAHVYLFRPSSALEKTLVQFLYIGTAFLIGGTILGGVWAAESWGRFWDWDPKESWAFVSSSWYLIWIHAYKFKKITANTLAIGAILGLVTITFTWYGVNYILGTGLHSYGFGSGGEIFYYLYLGGETLFLIFYSRLKKYLQKLQD